LAPRFLTSRPIIDPGPSGEDPDTGSGNLAMSDHRVSGRCAVGPVDVAGPVTPISPRQHRPAPSRSTAAREERGYAKGQDQPAECGMNQGGGTAGGASPARDGASEHHERRLERLIDRLPERLQKAIRWLRRPGLRWLRLVAGVLLIAGSFLSILPIFGIWMLPVGVVLLAEDIPAFRRLRDWLLDWIGRHRPHWLAAHDTPQAFNEGAEEVVKNFTDREKAFEAEFKSQPGSEVPAHGAPQPAVWIVGGRKTGAPSRRRGRRLC